MVRIPAGSFRMGSSFAGFTDTRPIHAVDLDGFWIDATPVTNAQFQKFIDATGYVTVAEKPPNIPGVPREKNVPGALVFTAPQKPVPLDDISRWWKYVAGADWRHPEGPGSSIVGLGEHPVVQVCYQDAEAYARWCGKRLPTEAEFEYASRGGLDQKPYAWGDEFRPGGKYMANTFQGHFPDKNTKADGYERTSPVHAFPPNGYGLYDMAGNVWEWCSDWYEPDYYAHSPRKNPAGPAAGSDPGGPEQDVKVQRGGSFVCSDQYCCRYMAGARGKETIDSASDHAGFRCVISDPAK